MNNFSNYDFQKKRFEENLKSLPKKDETYILEVCALSEMHHSGQTRDDGTPYFIHCLRISSNLVELLGITEKEVIAAALLHDTVEDTDLTLDELETKYGKKVSRLVDNLTKNHAEAEEKEKYEKRLKKHKSIMKKDKNSRAIKALDHLDNVRSWLAVPQRHPTRNKFKRWFKEAETMYIPLAETVDKTIADKIKRFLEEAKNL